MYIMLNDTYTYLFYIQIWMFPQPLGWSLFALSPPPLYGKFFILRVNQMLIISFTNNPFSLA